MSYVFKEISLALTSCPIGFWGFAVDIIAKFCRKALNTNFPVSGWLLIAHFFIRSYLNLIIYRFSININMAIALASYSKETRKKLIKCALIVWQFAQKNWIPQLQSTYIRTVSFKSLNHKIDAFRIFSTTFQNPHFLQTCLIFNW